MKTNLRNFVFVLLAVAGGMALLARNAHAANDALPPEVKALIGMKIPAKAPGKGGVTPGWKYMGAGMLEVRTKNGQALGYELLYQKDISIFLIDIMDIDHNRTILDVRVIPRQFLNYNVKNGKIVFKNNSSQFYEFEHSCKSSSYGPMVVGLVRPEPTKGDCGHWSNQIKRAWSIDTETGHISDIPSKDVSCLYQSESICQ